MPDSKGRMVVCIDFDGVIHEYDGFKGPGVFNGPVAGAAEALRYLKDAGWVVIIYTTRAEVELIADWLIEHNILFDEINQHHETYNNPMNPGKPHADVYVDDKAVRFEGDWDDTLNQLVYSEIRPWWERR